jgi:hypothetical protein
MYDGQIFMKAMCRLLFAGIFILLMSCDQDEGKPGIDIFSETFDFNEDQHGFEGGFSDYPAGPDDSVVFELQYAYTVEPEGGEKAIMLSGNNRSDDLFMFLKKKLTGLQSNTDYTITFDVEVGSAGAPGETVFLKVGATDIEPKSVIDKGNFVMNIDKGNQAEDGIDMVTIGDVAAPSSGVYVKINRTNASTDRPLEVTSNNKGELWLIVGTDSGFKGTTTLYYTTISVVLSSPN